MSMLQSPINVTFAGKLGTFVTLQDGVILSIYAEARSPYDWNDTSITQRLFGRRSEDGGLNWGEPEQIFEFPAAPGSIKALDLDHAPLLDAEGTLHLYGFRMLNWDAGVPYSERIVEMWHLYSRDGGHSWTGPERIDYGHRYTGSLNAVTQLADGRIVMPFSFMSDRKSGVFVSEVIISDDSGYSWRNAGGDIVIDNGGGALESGAVEPVTVELPDGRVWMVIRTQMGRFYESYSSDGGETWSRPQPTPFISSNAPAGLLRLRNGRILMCWNHCKGEPIRHGISYARQSLVAAIREADGAWRGYREIVRLAPDQDPDHLVCYPWMTETADGKVLVGYLDVSLSDWHGTVQYRTVSIDPSWIAAGCALEQWENGIGVCSHTKAGADLESGADGNVLRLHADGEPAGITWNFPFAVKGALCLRVMMEEGFGGAYITLGESFLKPGNRQGGTFRFRMEPDGRLAAQYVNEGPYIPLRWSESLVSGQWIDLEIEWDCGMEIARIYANGVLAGVIMQLERGRGASYVRLFADESGGGLRVRRMESESKAIEGAPV